MAGSLDVRDTSLARVSLVLALFAACGPTDPPWPSAGLAETGEGTGSSSDSGGDASTDADSGAPPPDIWDGIPDSSCPDVDLGDFPPAFGQHSTWDQSSNFVPSCGFPDPDGPDAEFLFTAPRTAQYVFVTESSNFDTILSIYDGACEGPEIACNDDSAPGHGTVSGVMLELQAGQVVTVVVNGNQGATGHAHVIVRDASCAQITDMGSELPAMAFFGVDDNNHFITECGGAGGEAVFTWTAPIAGNYNFSTDEPPDHLVLAIIDGSCPGEVLASDGGTCSAPGVPASITRWVDAGEQVTILGDGYTGVAGASVIVTAAP